MIKTIGTLATGLVRAGKPVAGFAAGKAVRNLMPGGDIGLDVTRAVLGTVLRKEPDQAMGEFTHRMEKADPAKIKDLVMDVLTLSELVRAANADGKLSEDEKTMILNAIDELREESEKLLGIGG